MTNAEKALRLHEEWNGKFETTPKMKIQTREDLALAYTPGVAEPCKVIAKDKEAAYKYTIKANTIADVSKSRQDLRSFWTYLYSMMTSMVLLSLC